MHRPSVVGTEASSRQALRARLGRKRRRTGRIRRSGRTAPERPRPHPEWTTPIRGRRGWSRCGRSPPCDVRTLRATGKSRRRSPRLPRRRRPRVADLVRPDQAADSPPCNAASTSRLASRVGYAKHTSVHSAVMIGFLNSVDSQQIAFAGTWPLGRARRSPHPASPQTPGIRGGRRE